MSAVGDESDDLLMPKKGGHSTAVELRKPDDDAQGVIICKQRFGIVAAQQVNTTNLFNHLQRYHNIQNELQ